MKLLAIDSSAKSASAAIVEDGMLISECFVNAAITHSCTLMPMIDNALSHSQLNINDIDAFAVNAGPGSFTGIRIGVAAIKGLAFIGNKPCASVSTLESMAYNFTDDDCIVCGTMDARCNQVYTAIFRIKDGQVTRLTDDNAESIDELCEELLQYNEKIYLVGDGAEICYGKLKNKLENVKLSGESRRYQRAFGTALAALVRNEFTEAAVVTPVYLRPPQAERELKSKKLSEETK